MLIRPASGEALHPRIPTRIDAGVGAASRVGEAARGLGIRVALLVTDAGVARAGHAARVETALRGAGVRVVVFDGVIENPTQAEVAACIDAARRAGSDGLVAVGGGSVIDAAKAAAIVRGGGGRIEDYWHAGGGRGQVRPIEPMIALPTTAGTGSEVQSHALVSDAATHRKMACGGPGATPAFAILDPDFTATLPREVAAQTGIDALSHALESAVSTRHNESSAAFAAAAWRMLVKSLPILARGGDDPSARLDALVGSCLAGAAIELGMLGAAHAAANPLTARFHVPHGRAVGVMLPHVVRFNAADPRAASIYATLAEAIPAPPPTPHPATAATAATAEHVALRVERLMDTFTLPRRLREMNIPRAAIADLAADAMTQWTGKFNPRPLTADAIARLYDAAW